MAALDELKRITAWETEPVLSEADLTSLLGTAAVPDRIGNAPQAPGWTPTYDLNAAAAEAWLIKAGRAAVLVEIDPPGSGIMTSKVFENCRAMARYYRSRGAATFKLK